MGSTTIGLTPGAGSNVSADTVTLPDGVTVGEAQGIKLLVGGEGDAHGWVGGREVDGTTDEASLFVEQRGDLVRHASTFVVSATPDYAAGDALGTGGSIASAAKATGGGLRIEAIQLVNDTTSVFELDILFFRDSITAPTDNDAFAPSLADLQKLCGKVTFVSGDWRSYGTRSVAAKSDLNLVVPSLVATTLHYQPVAQGAFNFVATTDLTVLIAATRL